MAGIQVGEGYVEIHGDTAPLERDIRRGSGAATDAGTGLGKSIFGGVIGAYAAIGVTEKVTGWIGSAIMAGSDYNETVSKGSAIFGDQMGAIQKWASTAATSTGLSTSAAVSAAASFGDMFSQIGFTGDEAAKMSTKVVQAAADLGSFSNLDTADVSERISAAFRGEYDSLQAVIPNISAARVEQEAMAASGKTNASALTAQEKASAVLAIVQKDGNRAMGDFSRTSGGFANQMKIAAAQSEDLKGRIGGALQPALQAGAAVITGTVMPALLGLADKAVPVVSKGVGVISKVFGNMGSIVSPGLTAVKTVWGQVWSGLGPALAPFLSIIGTIGPQVMGLVGSFSPLGLILKALMPLLPTIGSLLGSVATTIGSALAQALVYLNSLITTLTESLSGYLAAVLPIVASLVSTLVAAFAGLLPVATQVIGALLPVATTLIEMLVPIFTQLATTVLPEVVSAIQLVVSAVAPLVTTLLSVLMPVIQALLPVIQSVFSAIVPIIQGAMQIVTGVIQVVTGIITGNWSNVWLGIQNIFGGVWNTIVAIVTGALGILGAVVTAGLNLLRGVISGVMTGIRAVWSAIWSGISAAARVVWAGIVAYVTTYINNVRSVIAAVVGGIRAVWSAGWSMVSSAVSSAVSAVVGFVQNMATGVRTSIDAAVSFFAGLPGKVVGAVSGLATSLVSVGRNTIQGFIDGARSMAGNILSAVTAPIKDAIAGAKNLLGIHSPSRVFRQIGDYVGQGLVQGLKGSAKGVRAAAKKMTDAIGAAFVSKDLTEATAGKLYNLVAKGNHSLDILATDRMRIADRIKNATKSLTDAQKTYSDYRKSVYDSYSNVSVTDSRSGLGIVTTLTNQLAKVKTFTKTMLQLRKAGLDKTTYQQFIAKGTDALPLATSLLAGGKSQIKRVGALQGQLSKASSTFATNVATDLYGAGVNAAKGLLSGLKSQEKAIKDLMTRIAGNMTGAVKRALNIHSPSRVFRWLGEMTGRGLVMGLQGMTPSVSRAASALVAPVTAAGAGIVSTSGSGASSFTSGARGGNSSGDTNYVEVHMHAVTSDPTATARQAAREVLDRLK